MHLLLEPHKRNSHSLYLFVAQRASFHAPHGLALQQLTQKLDERKHELREPLLDLIRIHIHPFREDATKSVDFASKLGQFVDLVQLGGRGAEPPDGSIPAKLYGGQGPFTTPTTSLKRPARRSRTAFRSAARSLGIRTAKDTATRSLLQISYQTSARSTESSATRNSTSSAARDFRASRAAWRARRSSMNRRPGPAAAGTGASGAPGLTDSRHMRVTASSLLPATRSSAARSSSARLESEARTSSSVANAVPKRTGRQGWAALILSTSPWCARASFRSSLSAGSQRVLQ